MANCNNCGKSVTSGLVVCSECATSRWMSVKERLPTAEDVGGEDGSVIVVCRDGSIKRAHWYVVADNPSYCSYWIPEPPKEVEREH